MPAEIQLIPEQLDQILDKADETSLVPAITALNLKFDSLLEVTTNINVAMGQIVVNIDKIEVAIDNLSIPEVSFTGLIDAINALTEEVKALKFNGEEIHIGDITIKLSGQSLTIAQT